jgi:hypothetical protein
MQWKLHEFTLDEAAGPLKVFTYEVALYGASETPQLYYRGDGIFHSSGQVRLNREDELRELLADTGVNPQQLVEHLQMCVRARAEKLLRERIKRPAMVPTAMPAPASVAYYLRWDK